jgi:hypothetical protein
MDEVEMNATSIMLILPRECMLLWRHVYTHIFHSFCSYIYIHYIYIYFIVVYVHYSALHSHIFLSSLFFISLLSWLHRWHQNYVICEQKCETNVLISKMRRIQIIRRCL